MKTERIKYSDYMAGQRFGDKKRSNKGNNKGNVIKKAGTLAAGSLFLLKSPIALAASVDPRGVAVEASGAVNGAVRDQIIHAFDPLVSLMMDLALPVSSVLITAAGLMITIGMKEKGYSLMMQSCLGYVVIMLSPLFIKILAGIGSAL